MTGAARQIEPGRALAIVISVSLAVAAQYLFTGDLFARSVDSQTWQWLPRFTWASALLVAAILTAVAAAFPPLSVTALPSAAPVRSHPSPFVAAGSVGAALCYAGSSLIFLTSGEGPLVRRLWLLGVVLFLAPLLARDRAAFRVRGHPAWEWGLVAGLTGVAFWLRHHDVMTLPDQMHPDVAFMGNVTIEVMEKFPDRWLGLAPSMHPFSTHQVLAFAMRLFGQDHYGLVIPSVLAGTATVPVLYVLGRLLFGRSVGFLAAGVLAVSYTHVHFSRTLFGPVATLALTLGLALLAAGLRSGTPVLFALSGAALSFGLFNYYSARVGPVLVACLLLWQLVADRAAFRRSWRGWCFLVIAALLVFGPKLALAAKDFEGFAGRGTQVAIWNPDVLAHSMEKYRVSSLWEVLLFQARDTFLTFHLVGDGSPHFTFRRPMVSPLAAISLTVGIGVALAQLRTVAAAFPVLWLTLTLVLGGVITADPPYWPHLNIALPAVALLAGLGMVRSAFALVPRVPRTRRLAVALLAAVLVPFGVQNWVTYTDFAGANAGPRAHGARYVDSLPPGSRAYVLSSGYRWSDHQFRFLGHDVSGRDTTREEAASGTLDMTPPAAILLYEGLDLLPTIEARYPGGVTRPVGAPGHPPVLHVYERLVRGMPPPPAPSPWSRSGWVPVGFLVALLAVRAGLSIRRWRTEPASPPAASAPPA